MRSRFIDRLDDLVGQLLHLGLAALAVILGDGFDFWLVVVLVVGLVDMSSRLAGILVLVRRLC